MCWATGSEHQQVTYGVLSENVKLHRHQYPIALIKFLIINEHCCIYIIYAIFTFHKYLNYHYTTVFSDQWLKYLQHNDLYGNEPSSDRADTVKSQKVLNQIKLPTANICSLFN